MRKSIFWCLLMIGLTMSLETSAQQDLSTADQYFMMGSYDQAAEMYKSAWTAAPANHKILGKLVDTYHKMGKSQEIYNLLATKTPSTLPAGIVLVQGHTCKMMSKYDEAKMWYKAYGQYDKFVAEHYYESCDFAKNEYARTGLYDVDMLNINTAQSDYGAEYFNGQLVFASHRSDIQRDIKRKEQNLNLGKSQLYRADLINDTQLEHTRFLRGELQNVFGEGPVSYSEDGRIAAIMKSNAKIEGSSLTDGEEKSLSIYLAITDNNGDWTLAEPFPFNSTSYSNAWPYLMNGGKTMYFSSNRPDGFGGYDIYVSHRKNGNWTIPKNLGADVNSQGNEITPHLSNGTLFFASDWHFGFGGFDIFRAEIRNGNYAKIYHLGKDMNSAYNDYGLVTESDARSGYFTSNRPNGAGAEDIYFCNKISGQVEIVVIDAYNKTPVADAQVKFRRTDNFLVTDRYGKCSINLPGDQAVILDVVSRGYSQNELSVMADAKAVTSKNYFIELEPNAMASISDAPTVINSSKVIKDASSTLSHPTTTQTSAYANVKRTSNGTPLRRAVQNTNMPTPHRVSTTATTSNGTPLRRPVQNKTMVEPEKKMASQVTAEAAVQNQNMPTPHRVSTTATTSNGTPLRRPVRNQTSTSIVTNTMTTESSPSNVNHVTLSDQVGEVYAIQLASFHESHTLNVDMKPFKQLYDLGALYKSEAGGITKVRLGTYNSEVEARAALTKVKLRGYTDAFIVKDTKSLTFDAAPKSRSTVVSYPATATTYRETTAARTETYRAPVEAKTSTLMPALSEGYKVRLGAFSESSNFDSSIIQDLGYAEMQEKAKFIIIYLAGMADYNMAHSALQKMKTRGFKDAYVIINKNGAINKIH